MKIVHVLIHSECCVKCCFPYCTLDIFSDFSHKSKYKFYVWIFLVIFNHGSEILTNKRRIIFAHFMNCLGNGCVNYHCGNGNVI